MYTYIYVYIYIYITYIHTYIYINTLKSLCSQKEIKEISSKQWARLALVPYFPIFSRISFLSRFISLNTFNSNATGSLAVATVFKLPTPTRNSLQFSLISLISQLFPPNLSLFFPLNRYRGINIPLIRYELTSIEINLSLAVST